MDNINKSLEVSQKNAATLSKYRIAVVVPAFNEEKNISKVVAGIPEFVDDIVVIDDKSKDTTRDQVAAMSTKDSRVVLIEHEENQGVGGAIASGYQWCSEHEVDVAVVMAGDNQMDPDDLPKLITPVLDGKTDYAKGNRLLFPGSISLIPPVRFWGNSILSLLTKIASGYWHVSDSQCGYTAIGKSPLKVIDWSKMYKRYGQPNDLLVTLNINNFRVSDIPIRPVYNVGEQSGIKVQKVIFTISTLLVRRFFGRMIHKYVLYDFHPLVLFYFISFGLMGVSALLFLRIALVFMATGDAPPMTSMAFMFATTTSLQSLFFAMWMDMETNKQLRG